MATKKSATIKVARPKNKSFHTTRAAAVKLARMIRSSGRGARVERVTRETGKGGGYVVTSKARR